MNTQFKTVYFDTLTNTALAIRELNKKTFNFSEEKYFLINYFKDFYLKDLNPKNNELLNTLIDNEIQNNLLFLEFAEAINYNDGNYTINDEKIAIFYNYNDSLFFLWKYYFDLFERQKNADICLMDEKHYKQSIQKIKKLEKSDDTLIDKVNLICFMVSKKGCINYKPSYLTIINVFNNKFFNTINSLEFDNRVEVSFKHLKDNEIINNITNEEKLHKAIQNNMNGYIGFDPSAISLHLGNYVMINTINKLKKSGFNIIPVVGGATGSIGDPSGKKAERVLQDNATILKNKLAIIKQLKKYTHSKFVLDNFNNFKKMDYLTFLRDVGKLININYMLEKDTIKSRLETGISYTEFSYTLMQGYDFVQFYNKYNVAVQGGGSDQWGNITTGIEMIRKTVGDDNLATGFTINLLTKSDGTKFGKSEKGAVYLDKNLSSVYDMFQFLINQSDVDSIKLLKFLTTYEYYQINVIEKLYSSSELIKLRIPQYALANFLINEIHSQDDFNEMIKISKCLFNNDLKSLSKTAILSAFNNLPFTEVTESSIPLVDLLVNAKICSSRREAREMIENNSISINGDKYNDVEMVVDKSYTMYNLFTIIRKGKKNYFIIKWK